MSGTVERVGLTFYRSEVRRIGLHADDDAGGIVISS